MKVRFIFKGSIFEQKDPIEIDIEEKSTLLEAMKKICKDRTKLQSLLFRENQLRSDILIIVDKTDVLSMRLLNFELSNNQEITILPLAHGG